MVDRYTTGIEYLRQEYGISSFGNLERGQQKVLAEKLGVTKSVINKASEEARILSFFPCIARSKANPLSRLRTNKELLLFSKKYDVYNLEVREMYNCVKRWRIDIEKNPLVLLTDLQHDLIIGSTLGDANIQQRNRNCMFRVGHSPKQKKYAEWKLEILRTFATQGIKLTQREINKRLITTYELSINTHYAFNYYRKLFYDTDGTKIVTREALEHLNPRSLAIWICDDGSYCKTLKYIILSTNSFTLNEHEIMKSYFNEVFDLNPKIGFRDNKYYYLRFSVMDTKKLIEIIRLYILPSMKYKLGENNE